MGDLDLTPGQPRGSETILSEEIWEKILLNLTDPSDVLNAGKTCVQFQRILHSQMVEVNLAKTLPILMNYMDDKSVLKCRSVTKGWMGVVDNFFESHFLDKAVIGKAKRLQAFPVTNNHCALYTFKMKSNDYQRFMAEMKGHPRNPFIGRAVDFALEGLEERGHFRSVYNFFEIFGKHIWTLQLNTKSYVFPLEAEREFIFPFVIKDVFELAPNLKKLFINGVPLNVSMSIDEIRALQPPPALEKLQFVSLPFIHHQISALQDSSNAASKAILLRHSNSQLKVLHAEKLDLLRNLNWPNLKELHFTEHVNELDIIFRNLRLPKLESLSIGLGLRVGCDKVYLDWMEREENQTFTKFFQVLNNLCTSSPNLKTLRFRTTWLWDKMYEQAAGFPKCLPCPENIKTLEIPEETVYQARYDFQGTSDYSFLLRFPHVENIHVYKDSFTGSYDRGKYRCGPAFTSEIIQVHKFMYCGRMYESNIWKVLPKLKVFAYEKGLQKKLL